MPHATSTTVESGAGGCIQIEQLEIYVRVGITENERLHPQRITVTMTLWPNTALEELHDDINRAVNYSEVCRATREFVQARSDKLIETMVTELARHILERFEISAVEIELRKFVLPDARHVAVIVKRSAGTE